MKNLIAISSLILVISSCTTPGQVQQESEDRFNSMTTESVELCTSVTGQGDPLETISNL
jgi:PBP1b-binding outer membrane lipoprotein LpoB